ncbi:MAG: zinc ribbon domain-containing protein [Bryobacter sp.]|jgi:predicted nucleic acid-binding Zn ribbon protein|nr:zinc ribbon domain-containing protein [Bryobacter sp. CoA8 C33]
MPIYEYRCLECGKTFESIQKFSDEPYAVCGQAPSANCPHQGQGKVERLLGSPAFQFKGSGFYITDYTKSGGGSKTKGDSGAKPSPSTDSASPSSSSSSSSTKKES